jgi:hypothetical protein
VIAEVGDDKFQSLIERMVEAAGMRLRRTSRTVSAGEGRFPFREIIKPLTPLARFEISFATSCGAIVFVFVGQYDFKCPDYCIRPVKGVLRCRAIYGGMGP